MTSIAWVPTECASEVVVNSRTRVSVRSTKTAPEAGPVRTVCVVREGVFSLAMPSQIARMERPATPTRPVESRRVSVRVWGEAVVSLSRLILTVCVADA